MAEDPPVRKGADGRGMRGRADAVGATPELEGEVAGIEVPTARRPRRVPTGLHYMMAGAFFFSLMSSTLSI